MTFLYSAFLTQKRRHPGVAVSVSAPALGTLIPSTVFDLDKTLLTSYTTAGGVDDWLNIESSPADGEAQTAYNFFKRAAVSVSNVGEAGASDSYWGIPNANVATFVPLSVGAGASAGDNTDFLNNIQRTNVSSPTTFCQTFFIDTMPSTKLAIWGNVSASGQARSLAAFITPGGAVELWQHVPGNNATQKTVMVASGNITTSTNYFLAIGFNYSTGDGKSWLNTTVGTSVALANSSCGFNASRLGVFNIMGQGANNSLTGQNLSRLFAFSGFNEILSDDSVSVVKAEYESSPRQNRTY